MSDTAYLVIILSLCILLAFYIARAGSLKSELAENRRFCAKLCREKESLGNICRRRRNHINALQSKLTERNQRLRQLDELNRAQLYKLTHNVEAHTKRLQMLIDNIISNDPEFFDASIDRKNILHPNHDALIAVWCRSMSILNTDVNSNDVNKKFTDFVRATWSSRAEDMLPLHQQPDCIRLRNLGLSIGGLSESAEMAGTLKKLLRDGQVSRYKMVFEAGDLFYYLIRSISWFNISIEEVYAAQRFKNTYRSKNGKVDDEVLAVAYGGVHWAQQMVTFDNAVSPDASEQKRFLASRRVEE